MPYTINVITVSHLKKHLTDDIGDYWDHGVILKTNDNELFRRAQSGGNFGSALEISTDELVLFVVKEYAVSEKEQIEEAVTSLRNHFNQILQRRNSDKWFTSNNLYDTIKNLNLTNEQLQHFIGALSIVTAHMRAHASYENSRINLSGDHDSRVAIHTSDLEDALNRIQELIWKNER